MLSSERLGRASSRARRQLASAVRRAPPPAMRAVFTACTAALALCCCPPWLLGEVIAPADTGTNAQQQAAAAIPFDKLSDTARAKLSSVVSRPSIYRRLPAEVIACDRDMYLTLVRNPEIIVGIWRLMDITDVDMQRTGPFTFKCDDKAGTTSQIELIYGTAETHIFYADTLYEGSLFARPVKGRVVLLLRSEYVNGEDGRPQVKSVMDAFITIDHVAANLVARTLAPLVGRTADHNFSESFRFVGRVSDTAEENAPGMREMAKRLENVDKEVQQKLADVSTVVARRAAARRELAALRTDGMPIVDRQSQRDSGAAPSAPSPADATRSMTDSAFAIPRRTIQLRR